MCLFQFPLLLLLNVWLPIGTMDSIEWACKDFFWGLERWVEEVCIWWPGIDMYKPNKEGGWRDLEAERMESINWPICWCMQWRVCMDEGSLWRKFVRAKYKFDGDRSSYLFNNLLTCSWASGVYLQVVRCCEWWPLCRCGLIRKW